jgi:hypothetical protein
MGTNRHYLEFAEPVLGSPERQQAVQFAIDRGMQLSH